MDLQAFFRNEVKPALGCTEPACVALAAAAAARQLGSSLERIHLRLSANIAKNGMHVGIPGAPGLRGNLLAAALGALAGEPDKGLLVLERVAPQDVAAAKALLEAGAVSLEIVHDVPAVYAEAELTGRDGRSASAVVAFAHDFLHEVRREGLVVSRAGEAQSGRSDLPSYIKDLSRLSFSQIWSLAESIDEGLQAFLLHGAAMNLKVAEEGLASPWGLGVGHGLRQCGPANDLLWDIKAWSAAAADVRMAGGSQAVMSSAGSGNHGLTAIIPPALYARASGCDDRALSEALALSHLVTGYIKARTGKLTPVCGCAVAAGSGAAAALTRLNGGTPRQAEAAIGNVLSAVLGMICDGAKASCALKVSTAAGEAFTAARLALHGAGISDRQGVIGLDFSDNARVVGELSSLGFGAVDGVILRLLDSTN
ncbi:serine dehydratase subunit alpha family protein [Desulfocurvibacter africanus]|uniref:L-cysteine desulfidase family protein n=1 Tax=Desulfocurvibacter africanus TaxID=873 RepID=UPI000418C1FD|nr:L-serine ammonia-lyase, iron-sulfur-dependent, subunit alpha [Desulfocurvibacter africanus]